MIRLDVNEVSILIQMLENGQFAGKHAHIIASLMEKLRKEADKSMEKELK